MANDYNSFTNAELSKLMEEIQAEIQRRKRIEEKRRWAEVRDILHNWIKDYGDIEVNDGEFYLDATVDFSSFGEIHTT
nr:MAG TPA: hypothetical protein [Caudoviricetes sp.]